MAASRKLAAIMFTDIVGSTAMMQRDRDDAMAVAKKHEKALLSLVPKHNGTVQNFMGDGSLCLFPTPTDALSCAKAIQLTLQKEVPLRIGIHDGEIVFDNKKVYGDSVNVASRIESSGHAGTILFSKSIADKIKNDTSHTSISVGLFNFKNVAKPMEIFALTDEGLPPVKRSLLKNQDNSIKDIRTKLVYSIVGLGFIAASFFLASALMGNVGIPDNIKDERIAIAIVGNQTGIDSLDVLGTYLSDVLYISFKQIDDVKLANQQVVKDALSSLGVLPGNTDNKTSFYEYTEARYVIQGNYYTTGTDSIEIRTFISDEVSGENVFTFEPIVGSLKRKELLAAKLDNHIIGYWVTRKDVENFNINPPQFDAYQEFMKGQVAKAGSDLEIAAGHFRTAAELDTNYMGAYFLLSSCLELLGDQNAVDSLAPILKSKETWLSDEDKLPTLAHHNALDAGNSHLALRIMYDQHLKDPEFGFWSTRAGHLLLFKNDPQTALDVLLTFDDSKMDYSIYAYWQSRLGKVARAYNNLGQYQKTIDYLDKHYPPNSVYPGAQWMQVRAMANLGLDEEIERLASVRRGLKRVNHLSVLKNAANEYYLLGNTEKVEKFSNQLMSEPDFYDYIGDDDLMILHYERGEFEEAKKIGLTINLDNNRATELDMQLWLSILEMKLNKNNAVDIGNKFISYIDEHGIEGRTISGVWGSKTYSKAVIYTHLGEYAKALEFLKQSFEEDQIDFFWWTYQYDVLLQPIFDYPAFKEFIKPKKYEFN